MQHFIECLITLEDNFLISLPELWNSLIPTFTQQYSIIFITKAYMILILSTIFNPIIQDEQILKKSNITVIILAILF